MRMWGCATAVLSRVLRGLPHIAEFQKDTAERAKAAMEKAAMEKAKAEAAKKL